MYVYINIIHIVVLIDMFEMISFCFRVFGVLLSSCTSHAGLLDRKSGHPSFIFKGAEFVRVSPRMKTVKQIVNGLHEGTCTRRSRKVDIKSPRSCGKGEIACSTYNGTASKMTQCDTGMKKHIRRPLPAARGMAPGKRMDQQQRQQQQQQQEQK